MDLFNKNQNYCRDCQALKHLETKNLPERRKKIRASKRKFQKNNQQKIRKSIRKWELKKYYGLTTEGYNLIFNTQNGSCAICFRTQAELKRSLYVDHNHVTLKVRGLLCFACNTKLGKYKADTIMDILKEKKWSSAIAYIQRAT